LTAVPEIIPVRLRVPPECDRWRLDHFLKARIRRLSRTKIQEIIEHQVSGALNLCSLSPVCKSHTSIKLSRFPAVPV
jgi:hypothetical protein